MRIIKYFSVIFLVSMISSCTEDLDVDYKGKTTNTLIVDGTISTDTTAHRVTLTRSFSFGETLQYEPGAVVTISDGENIFNLNEVEEGIYETDSNVYGEVGKIYTLNIVTSDNEVYSAKSKLAPVSDIDSILIQKEYISFVEKSFYTIYFFGQEPPELGQYYLWNIYFNDSLLNDTLSKTHFEEDALVNGSYFTYFSLYALQDTVENGNEYLGNPYVFNVGLHEEPVEIKVEMVSLPEEYFTFLIEVMSETSWRGSPWDPLPANVSTNISNNALGFFKAIAKTSHTVIYSKPLEED